MRVLALTKYGAQSASTRQRFLLYRQHLERNGVALDVSPFIDDRSFADVAKGQRITAWSAARSYARRLTALARAGRYDVIWLHYEALPYLPGPIEALALLPGVPVVFDYDDANFHVYDRHPNPAVRRLLGSKFERLLRGATAAICGNDYLADYARGFGVETSVVPTVVDTDAIAAKETGTSGDPVVVGWIGSPTTWRTCVAPALPWLQPQVTALRARLRAVGGGPAADRMPNVDSLAWSEEGEIEMIRSMDIGIMPLNDTPFERGKCGYKLIQYMACGLPTIASPVGVNRDIVIDGETGFLAATPEQWNEALHKLVTDPALRQRMGEAGRRRAEERYSLWSQQDRVLSILHGAAEAGK